MIVLNGGTNVPFRPLDVIKIVAHINGISSFYYGTCSLYIWYFLINTSGSVIHAIN